MSGQPLNFEVNPSPKKTEPAPKTSPKPSPQIITPIPKTSTNQSPGVSPCCSYPVSIPHLRKDCRTKHAPVLSLNPFCGVEPAAQALCGAEPVMLRPLCSPRSAERNQQHKCSAEQSHSCCDPLCSPVLRSRTSSTSAPRSGASHAVIRFADYRFENWKPRRAPRRPGFLRSFMRPSRVSRPASRSDSKVVSL